MILNLVSNCQQGENECTYYIKTGQCKFGVTCKFHHPQPANFHIQAQSPAPQVAPLPVPVPTPALYHTLQSPSVPSPQQYGLVVARPPILPGSYVQGPYGPMLVSPGVVLYCTICDMIHEICLSVLLFYSSLISTILLASTLNATILSSVPRSSVFCGLVSFDLIRMHYMK